MSTLPIENLLVSELAMPIGDFPVVSKQTIFKAALEEMGRTKLGIVCITDDNLMLLGIVTDGDIRRRLLSDQRPFSALFGDEALDHATRQPVTVSADASLIDAVQVMEDKKVWDLPVVDADGRLEGLLHLHRVMQVLLGLKEISPTVES
ncbi:CBS domain-containing protein [Rhizobium sp. M1]|uniref:CBS domain-containing protein n=1 Tax=Rhizobium sp. M1 TaxID=2035453 RepID=UPI000BE8307A|nr:CBS domain-containing protein [Rhizobium sp. M1]PDT07192.1 CBS domain-containing protein [Rhizobium sp. M1]